LANAAFRALDNGRTLVQDLRTIREEWEQRIRVRRGANAWKIADLLLRHPVVNVGLITQELGIERTNVYRALSPLVDAQVLVEFTDKKRNQVWRVPEVLEALDRCRTSRAARSGRELNC